MTHQGRRGSPSRSIATPGPRKSVESQAKAITSSVEYQAILERIVQCAEKYSLLDIDRDRVIVALSGGKDSLLLARALTELGVRITPICIDMGYERGWAAKVQALTAFWGIPSLEIIDARAKQREVGPIGLQISRRIDILDSIPSTGTSAETPCTHCYNVKVLSLESAAREAGITKVAFAHHMTDAIVSLIKEGLMRVDRDINGHPSYNRDNFEQLVEQLYQESETYAVGSTPRITRELTQLVEDRQLDTDEPPRQPLRSDSSYCEIIRPLFLVHESQVRKVVVEAQLGAADSGCGHGATKETQTPREMVHRRLIDPMENRPYYSLLEGLVLRGVADNGTTAIRARQHRSELLGPLYKPPAEQLDKL